MTGSRCSAVQFLLVGLMVAVFGSPAVRAGTLIVTGGCDLVSAVKAANSDSAQGGCPAGSGADRIVLTDHVELDSVADSVDGPSGVPSIDSEVMIDSVDFHVIYRKSGSPEFRIFHVAADGMLTLNNLVIQGGVGVLVGGNLYNRGVARVHDSVVNSSTSYEHGGGIYNLGYLEMINAAVVGGTALVGNGGGIANAVVPECTFLICTVSLNRVQLTANDAAGGGALFNGPSGLLSISRVEFKDNLARAGGKGGAILNQAIVNAVDVSMHGNRTFENGATVDGIGAALYNESTGQVDLDNATLFGNLAEFAGGIYNKGSVDIDSSTLCHNFSPGSASFAEIDGFGSSVTKVKRSLFANWYGLPSCDTFIDGGHNLGCGGADPVTGLDAVIAYNGGEFMPSVALLPGSNAIDAGGTCFRPRDQRGVSRGDPCDIGAYEFGECEDVVLEGVVVGSEVHSSCEYAWSRSTVPGGASLTIDAGIMAVLRNQFVVGEGGELRVGND